MSTFKAISKIDLSESYKKYLTEGLGEEFSKSSFSDNYYDAICELMLYASAWCTDVKEDVDNAVSAIKEFTEIAFPDEISKLDKIKTILVNNSMWCFDNEDDINSFKTELNAI